MKTREEYFIKLREQFSENNLEDFYDLKEYLTDEIEHCINDGMTEEEAIATLSSPDDIAKDFYEDLRLETISEAEYNVVPEEDVDDVFIEKKRKSFERNLKKIGNFLSKTLLLLSAILAVYNIVYIVNELIVESHLARLPIIFISIIAIIYLRVWSKQDKRHIKILSIIFLAILSITIVEGIVNNNFRYSGIEHYEEIELEDYMNIDFSLVSDYYIEVTTVRQGKDEKFRMLFDGDFTKKDIENLESNRAKKNIELVLGKKNLLNLFTKVEKPRLIVFIPEDLHFESFTFDLKDGDIRLLDIKSANMDLKTTVGDIYLKNINSDNGSIESDSGYMILEKSSIDGKIVNRDGKIIINEVEGSYDIENIDGSIKLDKSELEELSLKTDTGRISVEDSNIKNLSADSKSGQIVIKNVEGNMNLENIKGKILSESNRGIVNIKNDEGITIGIDDYGLEGNIESKSGYIKWIHNITNPINYEIISETGKTETEIDSFIDYSKKIKLESKSGDIRIIEKVN